MVRMRGWWWWCVAFANARRERGLGLKSRNRAVVARFRVHRMNWRRGMVQRGGVVVCMRWWWRWGCALVKREPGRGFWANTQNRAVVARFGARRVKRLWERVCRDGVLVHTRWWWWWWGRALAKWEPGRGRAKKTATELPWLGCGRAVRNGYGRGCVWVARWCVRGGGGGGVVRSRNARRRAGGPKKPKPSAVARFRGAVRL
jgi:hypothetical protein